MPKGFSGINDIAENHSAINANATVEEYPVDRIAQYGKICINNLSEQIEQCKDVLLFCLKDLGKMTTVPSDDLFVVFNKVILKTVEKYVAAEKIIGRENPADVHLDAMWQEDTLLFLILMKSMIFSVIKEPLPMAVQMWFSFGLIGDLACEIVNRKAVSRMQNTNEKWDVKNEICYSRLTKLSSGKYAPTVLNSENSNSYIEVYEAFYQKRRDIFAYCEKAAHEISIFHGCDEQMIAACLNIYCYRRWGQHGDITMDDVAQEIKTLLTRKFIIFLEKYICAYNELTASASKKQTSLDGLDKFAAWSIIISAIIGIGLVCLMISAVKNNDPVLGTPVLDTPSACRVYISKYPDGSYKREATGKLNDFMKKSFASLSRPFNPQEVKQFLTDFPEYDSSKLDLLFFKEADEANKSLYLHNYLKAFPNGEFAEIVKELIPNIEMELWQKNKSSSDEDVLNDLLATITTPEIKDEISKRINDLYKDFSFVSKKDTKEAYSRFIELAPQHPEVNTAKKRLIDLEVAEIAKGEYGTLPASSPVSYSYGTTAEIELKNDTQYTTTIRHSGVESLKTTLSAYEKKTITLPVGSYKVAVSAEGSKVRPFYGTNQIQAGRYIESFYIQSYRRY